MVKFNWRTIVLAAAVLTVIVAGGLYYRSRAQFDPLTTISDALNNSVVEEKYRFQVETKISVHGHERHLSQVEGQKSGPTDFYIKGVMENVPVEVYQINRTTYMKDPETGKWMVTPGSELLDQELFMVEINPLSVFNFTGLGDPEYLGRQKLEDKKKYHLFALRPEVKNAFLTTYFKDFEYRVWVDPSDVRIVQGEMWARYKNNPEDWVYLKVKLWDYGKAEPLQPPV